MDSVSGQLNLERCEFGSSLHSFWRWTCVCLMLLRKMPFKQMRLKTFAKQ
nr:cell shape-determining protein MreC [Vibrio navarrensis]